jgi:4-diphosphocytidyl-2-C-methyl-D-erythritol kinase
MVYKSPAKVNLFLKIVGKRGNYHELISRFLRVDSLYDKMWFESWSGFEIDGFSFPKEKNIIYKTYLSLLENLEKREREKIVEFLNSKTLVVEKRIPMMAGLGGGSSNSATFLKMVDEVLNLEISKEKAFQILSPIGSDILFFYSDFFSANVSGTGEIVEKFEETPFEIEVFTPPISCNTKEVYQNFSGNFSNLQDSVELFKKDSKELFQKLELEIANDLFTPALKVCPDLENFLKDGFLFSGSGSSLFKIRN